MTSSSGQVQGKRVEDHPLFKTLNLTQGTPRTITMADNKRYFLNNPDQPAVAENLAKYTQAFPEEKPAPSPGLDITLSLSPEQAQAAIGAASPEEVAEKQVKELEELQKENQQSSAESIAANASLADLGSATFELVNQQGIKEEGSCGDDFASNGTIALYAIHGTWSDNAAFAGNINTQASYNIFKFACQLAYAEQMKVKVISLSWSGSLSYYDREQVAIEQLAANFDQQKADKIWIIAHSHGCNIAARAANKMYEEHQRLINVGIFLACPTLDIPREMDFETLYAFYSQGDFTQMAGSLQTGITRYTINTDRKVPFATPGSGRKVYNIRMQMDGLDMDHISIKWGVLPFLAKILAYIDTYFSCYYDLEVNVEENKPNSVPLVAIRHETPSCGEDPKAIKKSAKARAIFSSKHEGRDMSSIGRFYISGVTWLTNLGREGWTGVKTWWKGGEPTIPSGYLTEIPTSPLPQSSPQPSSSSSK